MSRVITDKDLQQALRNPDYRNLIDAVISKYKYHLCDAAIENCVTKAIWMCLQNYNSERKAKFSTVLYRYLSNELKREIRFNTEYHRVMKKHQAGDIFEELVDNKDSSLQYEVRDCLEQIPDKHRDIIYKYYFDNMTLQEIGNHNGYTREAARKNIASALESFKKVWNTNYCVAVNT